jgi:hypothetical protein
MPPTPPGLAVVAALDRLRRSGTPASGPIRRIPRRRAPESPHRLRAGAAGHDRRRRVDHIDRDRRRRNTSEFSACHFYVNDRIFKDGYD